MQSVIFYGVGQNLKKNFAKWYKNGLKPTCLADASKGKHHSTFSTPSGVLEVLPLLEALNMYPDYLLYITLEKPRLAEVTEYLLGIGIPYERIRYCDGFQKSGQCPFLDSDTMIVETVLSKEASFTYCCVNVPHKATFSATGDFLCDYQTLCECCDTLRKMLSAGYYTYCDDCMHKRDISDTGKQNKVFKQFLIAGGIVGLEKCNFNCSYCIYPNIGHGKQIATLETDKRYDALELFKIIESNFDPHDVYISLTGGEISVSKYKDEITSIWNKNKWRGDIASNSSVFVPGVASLLEQRLIYLVTALDSGTSETFAKVKGTNLFEKVLNNLEKYAETGGRIVIRYVILEGINDSTEELGAFFDIMNQLYKKYPLTSLVLDRDLRTNQNGISQDEINACKYFRDKCYEYGINFIFSKNTFFQSDILSVTSRESKGD